MATTTEEKVMQALLELFDWHIRFTVPGDSSKYEYGYADAIMQSVINVGQALGETGKKPYKYEAYKRVMQYDTTLNYWKQYPKPLASYFPKEIVAKYCSE